MNKRIKKKHSFRKVVFIVKPGIDDDPEKCPTFKAYSMKSFLRLVKKLEKLYSVDFIYVRQEPAGNKNRHDKGR